MIAKELWLKTVAAITLPIEVDEKNAIASAWVEFLTQLNRTEIVTDKKEIHVDENFWQQGIARINLHEPIQYITGEAYFYGLRFFVDQHVLIPRPETELLVDIVLAYGKSKNEITIVDACTGSGCIGISIQKNLPSSNVYLTDVSADALAIAQKNAYALKVNPTIIQSDLLNEKLPFSHCDVLVSNPPYVRLQEKASMHENVVNYEPHLALFVPDDDALVFYKALAKQGQNLLPNGGLLAVEINEALADEVCGLFTLHNFTTINIHKDYSGKDRIVTASK
ncbi:MAG: peptide chain release factor N(5)-glutamine methyltransferase [Chryseotalea sp.]|nr:peptide chain release factor N(5)-glutamine methyltransferase [Flammeovirgaceae bacterium]